MLALYILLTIQMLIQTLVIIYIYVVLHNMIQGLYHKDDEDKNYKDYVDDTRYG